MAKVDPQQMALAQAIASQGSAGAQQQQAAANTGAAGKHAALGGAANRAGLINAPEAFLKQAISQVSQPYDNAARSASNTSAAINSYTNTLKGANDNYMSQLQGAIPLVQAEVDKGASSQNLGQMLQLYNLQRQQALDSTKLNAEKEAVDIESNRKTVMNKILTNPDKNLGNAAINIISSNTSESLPEALAYLNSEQGKKDLKKMGVSDDAVLRQTLTEYYSDPQTYAALQSAQAAAPQAQAAAPQAATGGSPFAQDFSRGIEVLSPYAGDAVKSLVPGGTKNLQSLKNYFFGK